MLLIFKKTLNVQLNETVKPILSAFRLVSTILDAVFNIFFLLKMNLVNLVRFVIGLYFCSFEINCEYLFLRIFSSKTVFEATDCQTE